MSKLNPEQLLSPSKQNIGRILAEYGIRLDRFELAAGGIENLTVIITSGVRKYVLRVYPQQAKNDAEIELEIDFMAALRKEDLPVPQIISSGQPGELVITEIDGLGWQSILMEFASGEHPRMYTLALVQDMAKAQAAMHNIGMPYAQAHKLSNKRRGLRETLVVHKLLRDASTDPRFREFLKRVQEYEVSLSDTLPVGISHFDYDADNLLIQNDKVTAILDFGDVACMPLVVCLGYTLWDILFEEGGSAELASAYIRSYEKLRQLSHNEKSVLNQIILFRHYVISTFQISFGNFTHNDFEQVLQREEYLKNLNTLQLG